ncbi:MAG: DUF4249 domain-containing protein, partial [Prevotellaceae bacterium]|nr:DUF4249 domain-containing protein [Prevotellaceae bacterium]
EPTLIAEFQDIPVVEGYLYSGAPASVKISKLIPYRNDVTFSDEDVSRLHVEIVDETDGATYTLLSQGGGLYADTTLLPGIGHAYRLQFAYNGEQVSALTQVAAAPEGVTVSPTSITVPTWGGGGGGFGGGGGGGPTTPAMISIEWSNPNLDYYLVVVDNVDSNPTSVRDSLYNATTTDSLSFLTELTQDSIVQLSSQQFSYTGRHIVKLCRVQPEYVVMLQANTDSRSEPLTEVHANVVNGFGIFTGMAVHRAVITVHK